ncbi:hypothetical protein N8950_03515 [Candidatus Pelagibacter sp.]|jgi:hypothetical protein|nr:hypothetical protein [Candidatus Pelagibacter sp.]|tara:strand:+ start:54 stop:269 length:216 start_codon:yes stop_codon:yes gene_type:complete
MDNKTFPILIIIVAIGVPYYQNFIGDPMEDSVTFTVMCLFSALFWYVLGSAINKASKESAKKKWKNRMKKK